jgi:hypothetical protein
MRQVRGWRRDLRVVSRVLKESAPKAHRTVLNQFNKYVKLKRMKRRSLEEKFEAFLGHTLSRKYKKQKLKPTTVRTIAGNLIGALQVQANAPVGGMRIKSLMRSLHKSVARTQTKKAKPITPKKIRSLGLSKPDRLIALLATVSCQRMASMHTLQHVALHEDNSWEVIFRHKTELVTGTPGHIRIPIGKFPSLLKLARGLKRHQQIFKETRVSELIKTLRKKKCGLHSFRRGGILFWYRLGIPVHQIRQWTLHTTDAALLKYLDIRGITIISGKHKR